MNTRDTILLRNIIATITYYDVLDFPMTAFEIWRHMVYAPAQQQQSDVWTLGDVCAVMHGNDIKTFVEEDQGFYVLRGRKQLIKKRQRRDLLSTKKIKKLRRYVFWLRVVPFVRMIALTGRLSYKNGDDDSDLDVLVVCAHGHIWMGRFLMTMMTQFMGVRRHGDKHADRVCLNYYITDASLEVPTKDLYAAHEYSFITPLYGRDVFVRFMKANQWIKKYKPQYVVHDAVGERCLDEQPLLLLVRRSAEVLLGGSWLERLMRTVQQKKITANPKTQYPGAIIIATDGCLTFLPKPHGPRVFEEYQRRFDALELPWRV